MPDHDVGMQCVTTLPRSHWLLSALCFGFKLADSAVSKRLHSVETLSCRLYVVLQHAAFVGKIT